MHDRFALAPVDIVMLVAYAAFILWHGLHLSGKHENADDYFLAGRSMTWPLVGASLYASNISSTTLVGLAGSAYGTGISVFNYEWMAAVVLVFFALFVLPFYLNSRVYTMPQFLEKRYDGRSRTYFSIVTLFGNIIVDTAGSLYAGALVLRMIFPNLPIWETIAVLALLSGIYTIAGGLRAVILTDAAQAILLQVGAIIIAISAFIDIGGHWSKVTAITGHDMLSLVRPANDPTMPWTGLVLGVPLLGFYFWCTNQFMVQRVLSAKNVQHGRLGALFAGALKLPVLFLMVLPGTMARVLYPNLSNPDLVYPTLMFDMLPTGLLGLVLAGFIAALMSQIDSTLNSASTLVTMDFIRRWKPSLGDRALLKTGRWVTFGFMLLAAIWAPQIARFGSLFQYLQNVLAYLVPPVVAVFLVGLFWRRANAAGAITALLTGLGVSILLLAGKVLGLLPEVHFLHVAMVLFLFSATVQIGVSLATAAPPEIRTVGLTWNRQLWHLETISLRELPWYSNVRVLSIILLIATAGIVGWFW